MQVIFFRGGGKLINQHIEVSVIGMYQDKIQEEIEITRRVVRSHGIFLLYPPCSFKLSFNLLNV